MPPSLQSVREFYAREVAAAAHVDDAALIRAFTRVSRERFLGPGPWRIVDLEAMEGGYWVTPDADPRRLYHNVLVAIDAERGLNNGQPSALALWIDALGLRPGMRAIHIGCGLGYYTAIMAETMSHGLGTSGLIGGRAVAGTVSGVEVDAALAARARESLKPWPRTNVETADGWGFDPGDYDAMLVNAGVAHPHPVWLERLRPGGRLVFPLTFTLREHSAGLMMRIARRLDGLAVDVVSRVAIYAMTSGRTEEDNLRVGDALRAAAGGSLPSRLRTDRHAPEAPCWLHLERMCFSR